MVTTPQKQTAAKTQQTTVKPIESDRYIPLHLKYRPKTLSDLVGQTSVQTTLSNALMDDKIAPAYLFCGARGTGKTSSARILAKSLNCLRYDRPHRSPCGQCDSCKGIENNSNVDVMELDAASNNGVEHARELIERAAYSPVRCRYKVYVIDECHSLSNAAFNSLLKTIEEPPPRVVFILCTTEPQKVLDTIRSRCQIHTFKRVSTDDIIEHLRDLCSWENIIAAEDVLRAIAIHSEGGIRTAQTMLDKLALVEQPILLNDVYEECGIVPEDKIMDCIKALFKKDMDSLIRGIAALQDTGREPQKILEALIRVFRDLAILSVDSKALSLVHTSDSHHKALLHIADRWGIAKIHQCLDVLMQSEQHLNKTGYPRLWAEVTMIRLGGLA